MLKKVSTINVKGVEYHYFKDAEGSLWFPQNHLQYALRHVNRSSIKKLVATKPHLRGPKHSKFLLLDSHGGIQKYRMFTKDAITELLHNYRNEYAELLHNEITKIK